MAHKRLQQWLGVCGKGDNMFSIGMLFWILMIVWLLFGGYRRRDDLGTWASDSLLLWVVIALLGWATFGGLIK